MESGLFVYGYSGVSVKREISYFIYGTVHLKKFVRFSLTLTVNSPTGIKEKGGLLNLILPPVSMRPPLGQEKISLLQCSADIDGVCKLRRQRVKVEPPQPRAV